jgi:CBS domain-containing protein/sporulation protein YlmC with PRC-barrel domain
MHLQRLVVPKLERELRCFYLAFTCSGFGEGFIIFCAGKGRVGCLAFAVNSGLFGSTLWPNVAGLFDFMVTLNQASYAKKEGVKMVGIRSFYLSRVLNAKVRTPNGKQIGILHDFIATSAERPKVVACIVKMSGALKILDWNQCSIDKEKGYRVSCGQAVEIPIPEHAIYLKKHIMDKQIVDIDGKKVVRVNDVRLASISSGLFVMAVDVGVEGLLRRLDIAKPLKSIFGKHITSKLILWSNMEAIAPPLSNLKLSTSSSKLNTLHPSELADIIEELDINTRTAIFNALDHERAADVLEELEADTQSSILDQMPVDKAADLLEKMPADEVADILDDLEEDKAEELLQEMEQEASAEVRELMEYPEHSVGSIMTTDFISFKETMTVDEVIKELRRRKPESDTIYYLYVLDEEEKLTATVSLRDLIISAPETKLEQIMKEKIVYVYDTDPINSLVDIISKYSLLGVPVVDQDMVMLGVVIIDDVVYELLKPKKRKM